MLQQHFPRIWHYLLTHADHLDKRKSSLYRNRPRFSIFGVGDYTFAPWKVAISGLYKNLLFQVVGSDEGKPIVLDDTCCFLPCEGRDEAEFLAMLLNSQIAAAFIRSLTFFDAKRPITIDLLKRIDLRLLAAKLGMSQGVRIHLKWDPFEVGSI